MQNIAAYCRADVILNYKRNLRECEIHISQRKAKGGEIKCKT